MANHRRGRINDEVRNEVSLILRDVKDPRITDAFVSVTAAAVTPDLKFAKIYYSHLRGEQKEVASGLKSSAGYVRRMLAQKLNLRVTPELTFVVDESIAHGAHISAIINKFEYSDDSADEGGKEPDGGDADDE